MGYTTKFTGSINLSRPLTFAEARTLLEMNEGSDETKKVAGINSYMQWVPTESLDAIVWDGNEKFYEFKPLMTWLCSWLGERGIAANGELLWSGESAGDVGQIKVADNEVTVTEGKPPRQKAGKPLTLDGLARLALASMADGEG